MTDQRSPRFDDLLPGYVLGALDADELHEFEQLLAAGGAELRQQLAQWRAQLEELATAVPPAAPAAESRAAILAAVSADAARRSGDSGKLLAGPRPPTASGAPRWPRWLVLPAAALLLVAFWSLVRQGRLGEQVRQLTAERAQLERDLRRSEAETERLARTVAVIAAPGVQSIALAGSGSAAGAAGRTYVNGTERKAIFYAFDLPSLPPEKTYELWFFAGGKPIPAGTFTPDPGGRGALDVNLASLPGPEGWAVTIEPRGGVSLPTGEIVLKG